MPKGDRKTIDTRYTVEIKAVKIETFKVSDDYRDNESHNESVKFEFGVVIGGNNLTSLLNKTVAHLNLMDEDDLKPEVQ